MAFYRGLIAIKTEWVLLLACDLPYLNEAELREWIKYIDKVPPTAIALVPKSDRGWEPLAAFYRTNCLSLLKDFIARGDRSFQIWLSENQVMELPIRDRHILFNCNNPEDLATLS
jgi:molybdopterin-guanine dinucleotide biosynthesis protein A